MSGRESSKPEMEENLFVSSETFLGRDIRLLQLAGLYSMNSVFSDKPARPTIWEPIVFAIGLFHILFVLSCEILTMFRIVKDNPEQAIENFTAVSSGILCSIKGLRLWFWREEFRKILRLLATMWNQSCDRARIFQEMTETARDTWIFSKWYIIIVTTFCISYSIRPYILLLHYKWYQKFSNISYDYTVTIVPATYPFWTTETTRKYILCVSWEQFVFIFVVLYWICSDVIFAQITTHTAIQFRVLRNDLEYITDSKGDRSAPNEKMLINRLSFIAKRHHDLYKNCELIQTIYNPIIFVTMLLTAINMCFCIFQLEKEVSHQNWDQVIKFLFHAITWIVQTIVYCGYAEKLTQQTSLMARAAYDCQWVERSKQFKTLVHIILMRSQKIFVCTAYGFFSVNLNQITVIANTAASYFALLKTIA